MIGRIDNTVVNATTTTSSSTTLDWDPTGGLPQLTALTDNGTSTDLAGGPGGWASAQTGLTVRPMGLDADGSAIPTTGTTTLARNATYTPFGTPSGANNFEPRLGYRGELTIDNQLYLRARSYQSTLGRFTSRDPLPGVAGTTTIADPYHYTDNNPVNRIDPTGMRSTIDDDGFGFSLPVVAPPPPAASNTSPDGTKRTSNAAASGAVLTAVSEAELLGIETSYALPAFGAAAVAETAEATTGATVVAGGAGTAGCVVACIVLIPAAIGVAIGCIIACPDYFKMQHELEESQDNFEYTLRAIEQKIEDGELPADYQALGGRDGQPPKPPKSAGNCDAGDFDDELSRAPDDGSTISADELLAAATAFLGDPYFEIPPGSGRYVSADGCRQVRLGDSDITGRHGGGPHANFETLELNETSQRMRVVSNHHVYFTE